jgi:hypothetical protein
LDAFVFTCTLHLLVAEKAIYSVDDVFLASVTQEPLDRKRIFATGLYAGAVVSVRCLPSVFQASRQVRADASLL